MTKTIFWVYNKFKKFFLIALIFSLASCASKNIETNYLKPTSFKSLKGWAVDNHIEALYAFKKSCSAILKKRKNNQFNSNILFGSIKDWQHICHQTTNPTYYTSQGSRLFFEQWFTPYQVLNEKKKTGLFTGYYVPDLNGSYQKTKKYYYPLYKKPHEKTNLPSRGEIEAGALNNRDLELLWVDDHIDAFFLHVQGSGRITLPDGEKILVGYSGGNRHKYKSIGKYMINKGYIEKKDVSLQSIKDWLIKHPKQQKEVLNINDSYVFFTQLKRKEVIGAQGIGLTPRRSLAIDKLYIPYGAPVWLNLKNVPAFSGEVNSLFIAQDTGSAIKGKIRGDVFWGYGNIAGEIAGKMKATGQKYILLPKKITH